MVYKTSTIIMNPTIHKFIENEKQKRLEARDKHLKKLGIISNELDNNCNYKPICVTDEEYAEICKYQPPKTQLERDISTIKNIMVFFTWLWAIGIALWIIILIANL